MKVYAILEHKENDRVEHTPIVCDTFEELRKALCAFRQCAIYHFDPVDCAGPSFSGNGYRIGDVVVQAEEKDRSILEQCNIDLTFYLRKQEKDFFAESLDQNFNQIKLNLLDWFNSADYEGEIDREIGIEERSIFMFLLYFPKLRQSSIMDEALSLGYNPSEEYVYYLLELVSKMYPIVGSQKGGSLKDKNTIE